MASTHCDAGEKMFLSVTMTGAKGDKLAANEVADLAALAGQPTSVHDGREACGARASVGSDPSQSGNRLLSRPAGSAIDRQGDTALAAFRSRICTDSERPSPLERLIGLIAEAEVERYLKEINHQ